MGLRELGDFLAGRHVVKECSFCFSTEKNPRPVPEDPMVGDLCDDCRKEYLAVRPEANPTATKRAPSAPVDPRKAGITGWIRDTIEGCKSIALIDLQAMMRTKNLSEATVKAQTARVKKAYNVVDGVVSVRQEVK